MSRANARMQPRPMYHYELEIQREEQEANEPSERFELLDDELAMIHINDDTYSYPTTPTSLQLLGLTEDDSTLWSFLRMLGLYKAIDEQITLKQHVRLLKDGMLDATPQF